jgi:hypothetical protein
MSRHFAVTPNSLDAIHAAVQRAMDGGGRVGADELAAVLAEHEPERHRQEPREMTDSEYGRLFESRFGHSIHEAAPRSADDEYQLQFQQRFGIEAAL